MIKKFFYDLETTGVNYLKHSPHQISGFIEIDDKVVEEFNFHVKPHPKALIEQEALDVSGVTLEQIMAYPEQKVVHEQIKAVFRKHVDGYNKKDKMFLIGFRNTSFDDAFLRMMFELCGDPFFGSWFFSNSLDVSVLATEYLLKRRKKMENFKLRTVATELGIPVDESRLHDALYDVYLTREIYNIVTGREMEL